MIKLRNYIENYKLNDNDQKQVLKKQLIENIFVTNSVFDIFGKIIKTIVNNKKNFGVHSIHLIAKNNQGKSVVAVIYLYRGEISDLRQLKT